MYENFTQKKNPQIYPEVQYKIRIQINLVNDITPLCLLLYFPLRKKNVTFAREYGFFSFSFRHNSQTKKLPTKSGQLKT